MAAHGLLLLTLAANAMALSNTNMGEKSLFFGHARAVPEECTAQGVFCSSCQMSYLCTGAGATPRELPCNPDEVCGGTAPASACQDFVGTSAGDCDCDTIGNVGFLADPYDSSLYFMCIPPEGQIQLNCSDGEVFSSADNGCIVEPTTAPPTGDSDVVQKNSSIDCREQEFGFYTNDPTCQTYTACYIVNLPGLTLSCADGEAFDTSTVRCVPQCDLGPAAFECGTQDTGAFPDTSDCTIFHACFNGAQVSPSTGVPCPDGQVFESTSMLCVELSADVVCPEVNSCYAAYCDSCGGSCPETLIFTTQSDSSTSPTTGEDKSTTGSSTTQITTTTTTPEITTTTTIPTTTPPTTTPPTTTPLTTTPPTTTPPTTTPPTTTPPTTTPQTTTPLTTTPPTTTPEASTTATGPPNCSNSPGYYEDASDCKQFWSCQDDDAGGYEAVLYRCPGPLVYVPSFQFCSLQSDLAAAPGCIAS